MLPKASVVQAAGASSFGMSGVNANALFTTPRSLKHVPKEIPWQRLRHWMVPAPHHMLDSMRFIRTSAVSRSFLITDSKACFLFHRHLAASNFSPYHHMNIIFL